MYDQPRNYYQTVTHSLPLDLDFYGTMKQYRPAFIYVRVTRDGVKLELSQMDKTHNHETSTIAVCQFSKLTVLVTSNESRSNQTDRQVSK